MRSNIKLLFVVLCLKFTTRGYIALRADVNIGPRGITKGHMNIIYLADVKVKKPGTFLGVPGKMNCVATVQELTNLSK